LTRPAPQIRPRELVLLARDHERLVAWYVETLGFRIITRDLGLPYATLESDGGVRIGIGAAPPDVPAAESTIVPQIETDDVLALLRRIQAGGGRVDGPMQDPQHGFLFASFQDPERNIWWIVDGRCP